MHSAILPTLRSLAAHQSPVSFTSNVIAFWKEGRQQLIKKSYCQKKLDYYFESAGPGCTFVLKQQSFKNFKNFLLENWDLTNNIKLHEINAPELLIIL